MLIVDLDCRAGCWYRPGDVRQAGGGGPSHHIALQGQGCDTPQVLPITSVSWTGGIIAERLCLRFMGFVKTGSTYGLRHYRYLILRLNVHVDVANHSLKGFL